MKRGKKKLNDIILIMTLLVRNEIDIIEQNIQFHLANGVDFIIATDNLSTDGTSEVLEKYAVRGYVHLIYEDSDNYDQAKWVTKMAKIACEVYKADWVIHSDADEFWWSPLNNLKDVLRNIPNSFEYLEVNRSNFLPSLKKENNFERMIYKTINSKNILENSLPPKIIHRNISDISISQGNHSISYPVNLKKYQNTNIEILHFPLRSYKQYESKIKYGGAAYKRNTTLSYEVGITWRQAYEKYLIGNLNEEFLTQVKTPQEINLLISSGEIEKDLRLKKWMSENFKIKRESFIKKINIYFKKFFNNPDPNE